MMGDYQDYLIRPPLLRQREVVSRPIYVSLGDSPLDRLLAPIYGGLSRSALTEAEARYGPYWIGVILGQLAFLAFLGKKVLG